MNNQEEKKEKFTTTKEKNKKSRFRMIAVLIFILIFILMSYIQIRGSYLEYQELGGKYVDIFNTNLKYRYSIMGINFIILFLAIYFTNRGIKKGLKPFFEQEKKEMPKILNKSIALVISLVVSVVMSGIMMQKIMLALANTTFGLNDPIFNLDISYYIFKKPVIEMMIYYFLGIVVGLTIYMAVYYIIVFNRYFDGVDPKMIKDSLFMKKITRNALLIIIAIAAITILNIQNLMLGKILTVNGEIEITGAGMTESTIKLWGYVIFAFVIVIFAYRALRYFKQRNTARILKNLAVIPAYLVVLFVTMLGFDLIFVRTNELDKEKKYLAENIENTKNAYNLNIEEKNVEYSGTITEDEISKNQVIVNNIPIVSENAVLATLKNNQTNTGYFTYRDANLAKYKIGNEEKLIYVAPREIANSGRTYSNKTYEYTHGMGEILISAADTTETGNIKYIQKDVSGKDEKVNIEEPRTYFNTGNEGIIATNTKNKQEYDYTDEQGNDKTSVYNGQAGLQLGFLDRLVLGIYKKDLNLSFSSEITNESKILINRNIMQRAKKALPYLMYDENPYTVINNEGKIYWVLDAYTISSSYPYSQYTEIRHEGVNRDINYIRNSIKVIIDAYDGTMKYYITDRTDPIAMAYNHIYNTLFEKLDEEIPQDISEHFVYPELLYKIQSKILEVYHNVKPEVLYRADDLWNTAKYNTGNSTKSTGIYLEPYYTMVKINDKNELGLVQMYTPNEKQNIISYLVGSTEGSNNKLKLYKFSPDSNIVSPMQLNKQIKEDESISAELQTLETTGTKITKNMIIVPIEDTLLYVEPIYQTMLNESDTPILKKVVVASGNKVSIGNSLQEALQNLLSKYAVDIEVENTDDIQGLIETIIKANKNLTESSNNNDWEMIGRDIQKLQTLIESLEKIKNNQKPENSNEVKDNTIHKNKQKDMVDINTETSNNNVLQ